MAVSRHLTVAALVALGLTLQSCSRSAGNSAPRVTAVPQQTASGGVTFNLDLSAYVTDPEGGALTYGVVSGGGSFVGSVYSRDFPTLGHYTVQFQVTDVANETTIDEFDVVVTTANMAVLSKGDNLWLIDTDSQAFVTVTQSPGLVDVLQTTLSRGHVVYESIGGTTRLYAYDPNNGQTSVLGAATDEDTEYVGKTSDDRVLFTRTPTADPTDSDLYLWNPVSGLITTISAADGDPDGNPFVASTGLVYYESGTPSDIFSYDPDKNSVSTVSDAPTAETMRGVLANDAIVFSRIGAGGEQDLHYFHPVTGLVEIGADLSVAVQAQTKTFRAGTSASVVVFETTSATDIDLYVWDPATGTSTHVGASADDDLFAGVTGADEVAFHQVNSPTDRDLLIYTHGAGVRTIAASADDDVYQASLSNGDVVYLVATGSGDDLGLYDTSGSSSAGLATTGTDDYSFEAVLSNDKVVYNRAGGSGGVFVVNTVGAPAPDQAGGVGSVFQGATSGGDFVVQTQVSAQADLVLWDESADSTVTISSVTGDDSFGAVTSTGCILFTRVVSGKSNPDLFFWNPTGPTETQLTNSTASFGVIGTFSVDNS